MAKKYIKKRARGSWFVTLSDGIEYPVVHDSCISDKRSLTYYDDRKFEHMHQTKFDKLISLLKKGIIVMQKDKDAENRACDRLIALYVIENLFVSERGDISFKITKRLDEIN